MSRHARLIQVIALLLAAALLTVAGLLHPTLRPESSLSDSQTSVLKANPQLAVLTTVPGGLRVLAINYLWIRSQQLHQAGQHYDAYQLASMICQLQPYYPGVWAFQAWNMAWNISVTTNTRRERWQWVWGGVELLRDQGIPANPKSLILYKELSWIFFSKIGGKLDDMHWSYKQRLGGMMQQLLGAPPFDDQLGRTLEEQTEAAIEHFRPIAQAPLDKDPARQGEVLIQPDQALLLKSDPAVAAYAEQLAALGVTLDASLLRAWNRWSTDPSAGAVRVAPPRPTSDAEKALSTLINDEQYATPRQRMLAFVRAQILWNRYRMDPAFMLELMETTVSYEGTTYPTPLDWRHAMSHALYWASYGLKVCDVQNIRQSEALNHARNVLNSLKTLTATGLIALRNRPDEPLYPSYFESADLRYIQPTHAQHMAFIDQLMAVEGKNFNENILKSGHINYLDEAINLLVADGRIAPAQRYLDFIREDYKRTEGPYANEAVEDFVVANIAQEGSLRYPVTMQLLQFTLKRAYIARGLSGNEEEFRRQFDYAVRIFSAYQNAANERMKIPGTFQDVAGRVLQFLIGRPRIFGLTLSVGDRSDIYLSMRDQPAILVRVYHSLESLLRALSQQEGVDFETAFPPPPGLEEFRRQLRQRMTAQPEDKRIPR
jgi:hypothetical protein